MSAYRRLTNRFCSGKRFLNLGGGGGGGGGWGWGCYSKKQLSIFHVKALPENPVSMGGFYK